VPQRPLLRLQRLPQRAKTLLATLLGVAVVVLAGLWDAQRQADEQLRQLVRDQHLLAVALATRFPEEGSSAQEREQRSAAVAELLTMARLLEAEGNVVTMLHTPDRPGFVLSDGRVFGNQALETALMSGQPGTTLARDAAALLGLKHRVAVAGVARIRWPAGGVAGIAVVGSASQERDRARRDEWRTVLVTLLVSAMILGFGGVALRRQRRELELQRQVEVHRTERERDVELARADRMAAMAALASGIAHEISTPLGIISGRIEELVERGEDGVERNRLLSSAAQQVERINKVIRSFLGLARGDAPVLTRVSATQLAREAALLVEHRFATAAVALRVVVRGAEASLVSCEPALFEQVIVNLLINALEASERGQTVELRVEAKGEHVEFTVLDEGQGISPAIIAHATEPFFTTKARKGGSGLGLAIAREIVAHHRGELKLERRDAGGQGGPNGTRATVSLAESV